MKRASLPYISVYIVKYICYHCLERPWIILTSTPYQNFLDNKNLPHKCGRRSSYSKQATTAAMFDVKASLHSALNTVETRGEGQVYEVTQLDKNRFNLWSTIGIQFPVTAAPLGIAGYTTLITGVGGSPFYFWGFLVAVIGQLLIALSLAELSSAYPHVSGKVPSTVKFCDLANLIFTILRASILDCHPKPAPSCALSQLLEWCDDNIWMDLCFSWNGGFCGSIFRQLWPAGFRHNGKQSSWKGRETNDKCCRCSTPTWLQCGLRS